MEAELDSWMGEQYLPLPANLRLSAVFHCITWFQTQPILTAAQIRYHSHLWDHRST